MRLALLLDLGETLLHAGKPIAHVPQALEALAKLHTATGVPLPLALVSDYDMPAPGAPAAEVERLFAEYVAVVRKSGLLPHFEPAAHHITLSTQAGVKKPNAAIFRLALQRLGLAPDLATAMFITEDAGHIAAARALGMTAWQFGGDFHDWQKAPALVSAALAEDQAALKKAGQPTADERQRQMLEDNDAVAGPGQPLAPGQTHAMEPGPDGKLRPTRKRFSVK
jgi:beta-phosphoglucomutase-like phosphatase (HAD superfamily)